MSLHLIRDHTIIFYVTVKKGLCKLRKKGVRRTVIKGFLVLVLILCGLDFLLSSEAYICQSIPKKSCPPAWKSNLDGYSPPIVSCLSLARGE